MMKVLFTTNIPSPYRVEFFNELGKFCDLTVLFEAKSARDRHSKWKSDSFSNYKSIFLKGVRIGNDGAFCPGILKYLSRKQFDIIIIGLYASPTGMLAIEYLSAKGIPFVLNSDGGMKKVDGRIKHRIKEHFISSAEAWLSTGKVTTEYLTYYGALREKIYTYPFTSIREIDVEKQLISYDEKQKYRVKNGIYEKNVVLSVGQFIYRKGYDVLLNACMNLSPDVGVYIVGGLPTEEYSKLKEQLGLKNVHFIEFLTKNELAEYYKSADVFVLPTREDIWGLVVNEAMSFGLPVVTTDKCVAGTELVENDANGYIVPVEDPKELATAINNAFINKKHFGEQSLDKIKKYTIEEMVQVHMAIFELICKERDSK